MTDTPHGHVLPTPAPIAELTDAAARAAIRGSLDHTLLVEAAAGTGKTTELVARVLQVILSGAGRLGSIALLTFTEKAAGEMKLRLRSELDRARNDPNQSELARSRARLALSELETANIGTIHGFCAETLQRYPIEAEVDPRFEIAQAERERALLAEVFDAWFTRTLDGPPEGVARLLRRRELDPRAAAPRLQLMAAARQLIETRDFPTPFRRPALDRDTALEALFTELSALASLHLQGGPSDPLRRSLAELDRQLEIAREYDLDQREAFLRRLARDRDLWPSVRARGELYAPGLARTDVMARRDTLKQQLDDCMRTCDAEIAACLSRELRVVADAYAEAKREAGLLDFFDLLMCTRRLLQSSDTVRRELQSTISHVFVDEFQDTDPVQSEIVFLLCADDPSERDPWRARALPGKLFLVGDPKQSIYRFRRADIALYERVKQHLVSGGAEVLQLTTSFRALPEIQSCVNAAFHAAMGGEQGQAAYVPLSAFRPSRPAQPAVVALPVPSPYGVSGRITKGAIQKSLPRAVAAFVEWLVRDSGWVVREHGHDVPVAARHVCLLFRRFRNWDGDVTRDYIRALEARSLPHVLSGGRSFHTREEVAAIRNVLTAIEWPDDLLHVYATLRGPLLGFHDETLFTFREQVGHLHPLGPIAQDVLDNPEERAVAEVLTLLRQLHLTRNREPIANTLSRFLELARAHAGLAIWPGGEQVLGNVLRVIDLARAYERRGQASSFRGFVDWLSEQAKEAQTAEAQVIEETSDGVRVMTVHAAKGLEFPVVVLCDPTAPARYEFASRHIDPERGLWAQSLCDCEPIELWDERERVRAHDAAEIVRMVYVATTRAQELLVVPVCGDGPIDGWLEVLHDAVHPSPDNSRAPLPSRYVLPTFGPDSVAARHGPMPADTIAPGVHVPLRGDHHVVFWDPELLERPPAQAGGVVQMKLLQTNEQSAEVAAAGQHAYAEFMARGAAARESAQAPHVWSGSMTQRAAADAGWSRVFPFEIIDTGQDRSARARGTRFGTLVHALFEQLDFAALGSADVDVTRLTTFAHALGRELRAELTEITNAVESVTQALTHPFFALVRAAAVRGELYREVPVLLRGDDGQLFDGVIDLAFLEPSPSGEQQLCIVDFKTDVELTRTEHYQTQLAMYADAASLALGPVSRTVLLRV
ncbi:MAG: UvrD-helicase domain-containing protein [Polyangiales bacterium]